MTATTQALKDQLEQLSLEERAELAAYLIHSLDSKEDFDSEAAWDAELNRRTREIASGMIEGEPAEDVFARLRGCYS